MLDALLTWQILVAFDFATMAYSAGDLWPRSFVFTSRDRFAHVEAYSVGLTGQSRSEMQGWSGCDLSAKKKFLRQVAAYARDARSHNDVAIVKLVLYFALDGFDCLALREPGPLLQPAMLCPA